MKTNTTFFAGSLALLLAGNALAAGIPMLEVSGARALPREDRTLRALASDPASARIRSIDARALLLDARTATIALELGDFRVTADRRRSNDSVTGNLVWEGQIRETAVARNATAQEPASDPANAITLVRNGNSITGNLRVHGQLFQIRPLANGGHAIVEVDEQRMPSDHPADYAKALSAQVAMVAQPTPFAGGTRYIQPITTDGTAVISIMVVATSAAIQANADINALIDLATAESNQGFANSKIGLRLELVASHVSSYVESGSFSTDLGRFRGTSDGYMDEVHALRDSASADVSMLIINNSNSCGLASAFGASAETAFAVVHWNCATGMYSFGHEIGHLLGARHDPGSDAASTPYAYGHGHRHCPASGASWRTVMALDCPTGSPRLNFWSNPNMGYNGIAMGTASTSNNARVLMENRARASAFRGPASTGYSRYDK